VKEKSQTDAERLPLVMAGLGALGLAVALYLTSVHYSNVPLVCLGTTGCEEVNRSIYSEVAGVSVALLGAGAYAVVLAALWAERRAVLKRQEALLVQFGVALAGALYTLYLTYVELFVLGAVCIWCVISALTITTLAALAFVRLREFVEAEAEPQGARHSAKKQRRKGGSA
jgi:uncharacterized membrane protein